MNEEKIKRINELYHKSKEPQGLTEEESIEQEKLRREYLADVRKNLRGQLNSITIVNPDGTQRKLKESDPDREK